MKSFLDAAFFNNQVEIIGLGEMGHGDHAQCITKILEGLDKIDGIFLEIPVNFQSSVDNYLETGKFDQYFEDLLLGAIKEGKDFRKTFSTILSFVRNRKMPIICVDSSKKKGNVYTQKSKYGSSYLKGKSRDEDMFTNVIETIGKMPGRWCLIAHAAHLDTSFNLHRGDPSLGKRLREKLVKKYFNVCLLKITKSKGVRYFVGQNLDSKLKDLLKENNLGFLIKNNKLKGFDALIIHA